MSDAAEPQSVTRARYVSDLVQALDNPEPLTQVRAAWILGELRAREATADLIGSTQRHADDPEFLAAVAEALGKIADESAVPFLAHLAHSSFLKVRLAAVEALARWRHLPDAERALKRSLHDPNAIVRRAARAALIEGEGGN